MITLGRLYKISRQPNPAMVDLHRELLQDGEFIPGQDILGIAIAHQHDCTLMLVGHTTYQFCTVHNSRLTETEDRDLHPGDLDLQQPPSPDVEETPGQIHQYWRLKDTNAPSTNRVQ